jgi:tRNA modification GTPase
VNLDDTIVAIATPAGRGGIGVLRLSGPEAKAIALTMVKIAGELEPRRATMGELIDNPDHAPHPSLKAGEKVGQPQDHFSGAQRLDEVVVTWFAKPHSYTTDDVLEIACHGAPVVLRRAVEMALARGARLAEPGEFTMRAFLNGRIDLTQAEAVRDLIEAQTVFQAKVAAQQMEGALANRLRPVKQELVELIAELEAGVDFAEDDVPVMPPSQILPRIAAVRAPLEQLAASFVYGRVVHEGLTLAIVGRPNVGKSSLFNRLVERERAIVTATPGTTRDLVSETVAIEGIPVQLVDTAGIREAKDEAESIGVRKSMEAIAEADVVLVVLDLLGDLLAGLRAPAATQASSEENNRILERTDGRPRIVVLNKADLVPELLRAGTMGVPVTAGSPAEVQEMIQGSRKFDPLQSMAEGVNQATGEAAVVRTSAVTGEGIDELRRRIVEIAGAGAQHEPGFLTNVRHQKLVQDSLAALGKAATAVEQKLPHEMLLLDLYAALRPLDEITGATTAEDVLNVIFGKFCIGK